MRVYSIFNSSLDTHIDSRITVDWLFIDYILGGLQDLARIKVAMDSSCHNLRCADWIPDDAKILLLLTLLTE